MDYSMRKDGLLTINSQTQILRSPGFLNHFHNLPENTKNPLKLFDLVADKSKKNFKQTLNTALSEQKNIEIDIFLFG